MTESGWLSCCDIQALSDFCQGELSNRRLALFGAACCAHVEPLLGFEASVSPIDVIVAFADGVASAFDVTELVSKGGSIIDRLSAQPEDPRLTESWEALACETNRALTTAYWEALLQLARGDSIGAASWAVRVAENAASRKYFLNLATRTDDRVTEQLQSAVFQETARQVIAAADSERRFQAGVFRDIRGNPFRPYHRSKRQWPSTVRDLARAAYTGKNDAYWALHDALLEAGESYLAEHFQEQSHYKGCWALDLLLGKTEYGL
jgi:hypothetical protein